MIHGSARPDNFSCQTCGQCCLSCVCPDAFDRPAPAQPPQQLLHDPRPCSRPTAIGRGGVFCSCGWMMSAHGGGQ